MQEKAASGTEGCAPSLAELRRVDVLRVSQP